MKTYNLKESLIRMDQETDFKYTLTDLYEACQLDETKKKELVQYIDAKDPVGMNAMLSNEVGVMTENISDDIPDDEMPELEGWSPNMAECPACGDYTFNSKNGKCNACSYHESLNETLEEFTADDIKVMAMDDFETGHPCEDFTEFASILKDAGRIATEDDYILYLNWLHPNYDLEESATSPAFQEGDVVYVKPSKKSGRVVSVKGDTVEVEIMGGKDPDRRDTFYTSDLEMEKPLNESDEELDFSCYNLTDEQIEKVKYIRQHLNTVEGYKAYYELEKEVTDEGGCMDIFYDLSADFAWDNRFSVAITKLALADNRPDLADPNYLPGGCYAEYMDDPKYANVFLEDVNGQHLEATLRAAAEKKLADMGYDADFVNEYFGIKLSDTDDNRVKVTVWGELSYEESSELADVLNHIVAEEDPDAYFDHETSGRMAAYIRKDQSEDIPDKALVAEWSEKFNNCTTWEGLKDVYGEFYNIRDDLNNGTHRALYDIIDKKIDELKPVEEALTESVDEDVAICWYNDSGVADEEAEQYCPDDPDKWTVDDPRFINRAIEWYKNSPYYKEALTEASEEAPAAIYSMLDAADKYVDNDEYPEGASEQEIIEIAKNNPDCMKVTKWVDGQTGPDEVVWERPVDTWYVSKYEGGAAYEPAEGGYHYETLSLVDSEEFDSKEAAQARLAELADEESNVENQEVVGRNDNYFRIKLGKYVGDCEEYHVESKKGAHSSGRKIYEDLNESILRELNENHEVKTVFKNDKYIVELHPDAPKPYWVLDATVENPLHAEQCFYDEERAIRFAKDDALKENVVNEPIKLTSDYFYDTLKNIQDAGWSEILSFAEDSGWIRGNQIVIPAGTVMTFVDSTSHFDTYWVMTKAGTELIPFNKDFLAEDPLPVESTEGMNAYNITFYMDSLDDNVMSGPHTTKKIYAASEEEAKKKLMDSSTDKYYIPTIVNIEQINEAYVENPRELMRNKREDGAEFDEETGEWVKSDYADEEEEYLDSIYHDYSEDELRKMGVFDNLNEAMIYTDVNGFLGDPGETYTMSQFRRMWQDRDSDPIMSNYDNFEEWVGETISQMDASEEQPEVAPSGRGSASCKIWVDVNGIMGDPGDEYTLTDLASYWEDNKGSDPVLAEYKGDWKKWLDDTLPQMEEHIDDSLYEESLTFADMVKMNQSKNAEFEKKAAAKFEAEKALAQEAKNWPDNKELTYEEALALARAYYKEGGDSFYETIEKYQFDDEVKMFGPMTVGRMKKDFGVFDSVAKDRMGE